MARRGNDAEEILQICRDIDLSTPTLGIKQLAFVRQAMVEVMIHWHDIGLQWGVDPVALQMIQKAHGRKKIDICFTETIVEWLTGENLKGTKPSWREVIVIMADPTAGRNPAAAKRLAELIAENGKKSLCSVPQADGVDDSEIGTAATADVNAALAPVNSQWFNIGIILGLSRNFLRSLEDEEVEESMRRVTSEWLRGLQSKQFGAPSWKKLVGAIGASTGGKDAVHAKVIADQHRDPAAKRPRLGDSGDSEVDQNGSGSGHAVDQNGSCQNGNQNGHAVHQNGNRNGHAAVDGNGVHQTDLQPRDVNPYLKLLSAPKLYYLGGELGLNITELRRVPGQELTLVFAERWLREDDRVHQTSGTPTWGSLIKALRSKVVGATGVAERIVRERLT